MKLLTRQNIRAIMAIALTAVAGAALAAIIWVAATTQGTRWLITSVTSLSAQKIEGRIIDHLLLTGVRITLAQQKMELGTIELRWKPLLLLTGTVAVQELIIRDVRIQDDAPASTKAPKLVWPKVPGSAQLFDAAIARLRVKNVSYRHLQEQPVQIPSIASSVIWQDGLLSISDLEAVSPSGQIRGTVSAGFNHPSLTANLVIALAHPVAEMDQFSLQVRQSHGTGSEQFAGTITATGSAGSWKLLELSGDVGMAHNAFNLRRLHLTRPGQQGLITADGSLAFTPPELLLSLQITASGLDLAPELNVPTNLSGSLTFAGTMHNYRGNVTLANQVRGWQAATVSATCNGTDEGMKLAPFTVKVLDGTLTGNLDIGWRDGLVMQGAINGRNLNPGAFAPDWKGVVNVNVSGDLAKAGTTPITGSIRGTLLESSLHGQALTGDVQANFSGNDLSLTSLALQGKGFDLHASGKLNQRITLAARVSDASRLIPGSAGTLSGDGWVRRHDGQVSGAATGTGSNLAYAGTQVAAAHLTARFDQGSDYSFHGAASLRDVVHGSYMVDAVIAAADGTLARHTVNATFRSADSEVLLTLSGGYNAGIWKGKISRLSGNGGGASWNLVAPATFTVGARKIFLSPLALTAGASERIEVAADLALNPSAGQFRGEWAGIDATLFNPWLPRDTRVEGRINGRANGVLLAENQFELDGNVSLSGGALHKKMPGSELDLPITSATASWGWRGNGLTGKLYLNMAEYGKAQGTFQLPVPARFPVVINPKGPLHASLVGQFHEKGIGAAMFPELVQQSTGELDTDLAIGGSWEVPQIGGTLRLTKAGAYLPAVGIHLTDVQLAAHLEKNLILIDSFRALSGPGYIEGTARLAMAGRTLSNYRGTIRGESFQTVYLPELRMLSAPNFSFEGTPQKLTLRGELHLPELQIIGEPYRRVIPRSGDVIVEGRVAPPATRFPLALDAQLRVILGERVFVKVAGIDAQLGGAMELSLSSLDTVNGRGEIKVVKGRYRTYGVNLEIVRGRLFFAGDAIDRPAIDFLALRTIGDIRAGVTVAGTLQKPVTKLYSEPAMPDIDILAYIVLGHPLANSGEQASLTTQAAGALLTSGQAADIQDQIKKRLGLSTMEVQGGVGGTTGYMGYKPLQVTPPGAIPAAQQPGITETMFTVGKYLTPQLYISYGKSVFTGSNLLLLRYDIFKQWQIETQTGSESGIDLFYKLEFK